VAEIRTLIVDDEPVARAGIRKLLEDDPDIKVIGEAGNGKTAVRSILAHAPDLVFLDIQMPEMDGFRVLEQLGPDRTPTVIFVTAYDQFALRAFEVQALDYVLKPFEDERFYAMRCSPVPSSTYATHGMVTWPNAWPHCWPRTSRAASQSFRQKALHRLSRACWSRKATGFSSCL
jgi:CheY-like chemotaxis protein